jgi:hypothetical protein
MVKLLDECRSRRAECGRHGPFRGLIANCHAIIGKAVTLNKRD